MWEWDAGSAGCQSKCYGSPGILRREHRITVVCWCPYVDTSPIHRGSTNQPVECQDNEKGVLCVPVVSFASDRDRNVSSKAHCVNELHRLRLVLVDEVVKEQFVSPCRSRHDAVTGSSTCGTGATSAGWASIAVRCQCSEIIPKEGLRAVIHCDFPYLQRKGPSVSACPIMRIANAAYEGCRPRRSASQDCATPLA